MPLDIKKLHRYESIIRRVNQLHWVDILGIVTFFLILLVAFFFFLRRPVYVTITVRLLEADAPYFEANRPRQLFVENLHKGLKETDQLGKTVVEILDIYRYPSSIVTQDVFATLKVKSIYNKKTHHYSYNGLPLLIGDYRSFRLQNLLLSGVIVDINAGVDLRQKKKFLVIGLLDAADHDSRLPEEKVAIINGVDVDGVKNFLADKVVPGLKMLDSQGVVIAEIISVNKTPGKLTSFQNNRLVTVNDPTRKHVEVTVEVLTEQISDDFYFQKEQALTVGEKIFLTFNNLRIRPTITSIKEAE